MESRIRTWKEEKHPDHFSARVASAPDVTAEPRADRDPHGGAMIGSERAESAGGMSGGQLGSWRQVAAGQAPCPGDDSCPDGDFRRVV